MFQISHKLLLRALASLKVGVKSGTAECEGGGRKEGMQEALEELAAFCDRKLRLREDEGESSAKFLCGKFDVRVFIFLEVESSLDISVSMT